MKFKVGDIVKVVKEWGDLVSTGEVGKYFKIESVDYEADNPYTLEGSEWLRSDEDLELVDIEKLKSELERITEAQKDTLGRFKESRGLNQELIRENKDLQEQLDYADKQLEKQAKIIEGLEDYTHELHDKLIEKIKGE